MTDDPASPLDALCAAHELPDQPDATFRALDAALSAAVGHILFTVLVHHPGLRQSRIVAGHKRDSRIHARFAANSRSAQR